ncbi:hypothetical protein CTR21_003736 [Salmonella enterica subsp. diarizonae]|nr:hypothetical protein [Salmonella enterica subsp. diarizonae]
MTPNNHPAHGPVSLDRLHQEGRNLDEFDGFISSGEEYEMTINKQDLTTITRERLLKIQSWRETYGPGSNIVMPAEEAEELARIALVSLDAKKNKCGHGALDNEDGVITCRSCSKEWNI